MTVHGIKRANISTVIGVVVVVVFCTACAGAAAPGSPVPTASPSPESSPIYQDPYDLVAGECFDPIGETDSEVILAARMRACDEPHLAEVFAVLRHDAAADEPYPGDTAMDRDAEEMCYDAFEDYVGISYDLSTLNGSFMAPSAETWPAGDRQITCYVAATPSAPLVRSVEGSED